MLTAVYVSVAAAVPHVLRKCAYGVLAAELDNFLGTSLHARAAHLPVQSPVAAPRRPTGRSSCPGPGAAGVLASCTQPGAWQGARLWRRAAPATAVGRPPDGIKDGKKNRTALVIMLAMWPTTGS